MAEKMQSILAFVSYFDLSCNKMWFVIFDCMSSVFDNSEWVDVLKQESRCAKIVLNAKIVSVCHTSKIELFLFLF